MELKVNLKTLSGIIMGIWFLAFLYSNWGTALPLIKNDTISSSPVEFSNNQSTIFSTDFKRMLNVNETRAMNVVTTFSKKRDLVVSDFQTMIERDGCNSTMMVYHITTSDGIYRINSENNQIISVEYNPTLGKPLKNPLSQHQAIEISQAFLQEKFGNDSRNLTIPDSDARELADEYQLVFPATCPWVSLMIDKKTGQVTEYSNWVAQPRGCMCWGDGSCSTMQNSC
jgi:hypothetical protein